MKKALSFISALALLATATACGGTKDSSNQGTDAGTSNTESKKDDGGKSGGKQTINLWSFTDEVPSMVDKYKELHPEFADKYDVKVTIVPTTDGAYQPALDKALTGGGADVPDMYCAEAAFVLKYTQGEMSSYAAPYKDLGIDVDNEIKAADIAQYTVDIGSNNGNVVGLGYQATGGAFIYRRSVAKAAFGSDDPKVVEEKIGAGSNSWDKFLEAAKELKAKNYAILSGDGDLWHAVENSSDKGWIVDDKLHLDPKREIFMDLSKTMKDEGYINCTTDWTDSWFADMRSEGEKGVLGFFWGGTWVLANKDTTKKDIVAKIITWITLDSSETGLQYFWANGTLNGEGGTKDTVASGTVMAKSDGKLDFLNNQNMFEAFVPANKYANGKNLTQYDETINTYWRDQVRQYTAGAKTREQAIADFKTQVKENLDVVVE